MKRNRSSSPLLLVFFLVITVVITCSTLCVEGRKNHIKKSKPRKHQKQRIGSGSNAHDPQKYPAQAGPTLPIFDILSFGAKGDGVSDDSKALQATWKAACKNSRATVQIPSGFSFLIKPITLQGPCMPHLLLQIDGTLLAPPKVGAWPKSSLFQWINLKWLHNFTIQGSGVINGQGCEWWSPSRVYNTEGKTKHIPGRKPTALRFYASYNVTVKDIKIMNSPQCHLKFDSSGGVKVSNITISSPESSPNTDGIHLQNTRDVEIQQSTVACGDDCVSIQTGCSNIHVHHINCGPGHGISLGGLGKDRSVACVSGVVVENIIMQNTQSGARIKTWQGGMGSVTNVSFSNMQVWDVRVPVMIDQYYCDKKSCKNQTQAVAISGIKFDQIIGTYSRQSIHLACSNSVPCTDVDLVNIRLKPSPRYVRGLQRPVCWNSFGKSESPLLPSDIDYCLRRGSGSPKRLTKSPDINVC